MTLNLKDLMEKGGFVSEPRVERDITWTNDHGEELSAKAWIRRESYHTLTTTWKQQESQKDYLAVRVATMVCDAEGAPIMRPEDVTGTESRGPMCANLFLALLTAVNEVNSGKPKPPTTSGSN